MAGPRGRGGSTRTGGTARLADEVLAAQLAALNTGGFHAKTLELGEAQGAAARRAPAVVSALADAATALGQLDRAEALRRQVLILAPGHAATTNNLAVLLLKRGAMDEAERLCRQILDRDPDQIEPRYNLALVQLRRGALEEAAAIARAVLDRKPDHARAPFLLSLALLGLGRYREAWPLFEARTLPVNAAGNISLPSVAYPAWRGEPLQGRSILIWMEQGLGDEIMMARFPALLKAAGAAQVSWICKKALAPLLRRVAGIDSLYVADGALSVPRHDYWTLPMSIPRGLGVTLETVPAPVPYIGVDPAARDRAQALVGGDGFRIGLVLKGSPILLNDANRSLPGLAPLAPLWRVPGARLFSLQKGAGEDQAAAPPPDQPLVNLAPALTDLGETAAVIAQLDHVVSVDTAVAHLAGALGKPVSLLLPAIGADWRWGLERSDSPWYPTAILYRQTTPGDWTAPVAALAAALAARA